MSKLIELKLTPEEAKNESILTDCLGDENAITPDNRSRIAALRESRFPFYIFRRTPFQRQIGFNANPIPISSTPRRPWGRQNG
jgi:hypothetical protein